MRQAHIHTAQHEEFFLLIFYLRVQIRQVVCTCNLFNIRNTQVGVFVIIFDNLEQADVVVALPIRLEGVLAL